MLRVPSTVGVVLQMALTSGYSVGGGHAGEDGSPLAGAGWAPFCRLLQLIDFASVVAGLVGASSGA